MHTIYSITDKYHLFEYEPDHFCGDVNGFYVIFDVDRDCSRVHLKINATLKTAEQRTIFEDKINQICHDTEEEVVVKTFHSVGIIIAVLLAISFCNKDYIECFISRSYFNGEL